MNVGVNYMREHMPSDARVHYALLDTGGLSVAATLISLIALVAHTFIQRRQILDEVRRRQAREKRISQSQSKKQQGAQTSPLEPDTSPEKLL